MRRSRRELVYEAVILGAACLYYMNNAVFKSKSNGMLHYFFVCYFNDFLAGCMIISFINLLLSFFGKSMLHLSYIVVTCLAAGLFWEILPEISAVRPSAVFDLADLLAYLGGSILFWMIQKGVSQDD